MDDDDDEEEEEEEEEKEEPRSTAAPSSNGGAAPLLEVLDKLQVSEYKGRMDALHSILVLTDISISAEPSKMRSEDPKSLKELTRRLAVIKNRAQKNIGLMDYHGLECESLASFLANKIEHLFLSDDDDNA